MQARLARSAYDALDIQAGAAGPDEVRAAFLQLTKIYHPARFARMSPEIQKLANEVFLALRAAHDQLARPRAQARPAGAAPIIAAKTPPQPPRIEPQRNQPLPRTNTPPPPSAAIAPPTARTSASPQAPRANVPPAPSAAITPPTQPPRANVPPPPSAAITPPTQPRASVASVSSPRPAGPVPRTTGSGALKRPVTPAHGVPVTTTPTGPRPAVGARPTTPAGGVPVKSAPAVEPELVGVYEQLQRGDWATARAALNALIALQPKPRYRALLQYSIGREAQLSNKLNEARVDLQAALEIDPDLQVAKTALAELFTRRK